MAEPTIFEIINDISFNGLPKYTESDLDNYNMYYVNTYFSKFPDCVVFVNVLNTMKYPLTKYQHYLYLHGSIPKQKRYYKQPKKEKDKDIEFVKNLFQYSQEQAKSFLSVVDKRQLERIKCSFGGIIKNKK
jgi:hypothetical protein